MILFALAVFAYYEQTGFAKRVAAVRRHRAILTANGRLLGRLVNAETGQRGYLLAGEPRYAIDERELSPAATGYTIDTVRALQRRFPHVHFTWLMGSDNLVQFSRWRRCSPSCGASWPRAGSSRRSRSSSASR